MTDFRDRELHRSLASSHLAEQRAAAWQQWAAQGGHAQVSLGTGGSTVNEAVACANSTIDPAAQAAVERLSGVHGVS